MPKIQSKKGTLITFQDQKIVKVLFCLNLSQQIYFILALVGYANLQKRYCHLNLVAKRALLESDEISGDQVESLLASVR